jgi:catechol 2,3-dioxygenase-like lactoylglutathione lyase family enzyme
VLDAGGAGVAREALGDSNVRVGYVVLYVQDVEACRRFWVEQVGMVEKRRTAAGGFAIPQVGFADQPFAFELVPLELMKDNPDGLDLAAPSIAFHVDDLEATHATLVGRGVQATRVGEHEGTGSFAFADPEGRSSRAPPGTPGCARSAGRYSWRSTVIGIGISNLDAATPMPPSHPFGGCVPTPRVEGFSAAQSIQPSMPAVVPAPLGGTART